MRYMMMVYSDPELFADFTEADAQQQIIDFGNFHNEMAERGNIIIAERLHTPDTATSVRIRNNKTFTTDGPFAETKEILGGIYVFECEDLDDAIAIAEKIPTVQRGVVEIRPVFLPPENGEMG